MTAMLAVLVACGPTPEQASAGTQAAGTASPQNPGPTNFDSLDQLLAPIALYPDQLLAQMLLCTSDPPKVTELDKWLKTNTNLKGTQLQDAAVRAGFEPSFVAMALFPQVVAAMAAQIDRTTLLGQAFTANRELVFSTVQKLRHQAQDVGTLKDSAQQDVSTKQTSSGEEVIVIEPANPQVVYVPQYNPQVVYTQAPTNTTVIVQEDNTDEAVAAGLIGFTAGIAMGAAMNNNYYYGPMGFYGGAYMYNDAWDDYYDHREDAREDWIDHREDLSEERTDRRENTQEQRTDRQENRQENRPENAGTGQRAQQAQQARANGQTARTQTQSATANRTGSAEARGYGNSSSTTRTAPAQRSGSSDAFSGYSSGSSQRASSSRGQASRSSSSRSRSGGGGGRRR